MARDDAPSRYQEIASDLRAGILRGDYGTKGRLPSERLLSEKFAVQRATVRQALGVLEQEGFLTVEPKRGAFLRQGAPAPGDLLLLLPAGSSAHLTQLTEGVTQAARSVGLRVRRMESQHALGGTLDAVPDLADLPKNVAGMILWPQNPTDEAALARLNAALPLVLVDRRVEGIRADCVRFDDVTGGQKLTRHFLEQGHRRVAFLTDDILAETVRHRWQGYACAHEDMGVPLEPSSSLFFNGIHEPLFSLVLDHTLANPTSPTAFVCSNDIVAFRLLRYLHSHGVRVPADVAVAGYGNTMPDYLQAMGLTTMDQSFTDLGARAAALLFDRLGHRAGKGERRETRDITIPVSLIVRRTSQGQRHD